VVVDVHQDVRLAVIQESGAALATPVFNFCQMSNFSTFWSFVNTEDLWVHVFLLLDRLDEAE
jgi:hypothetical protein